MATEAQQLITMSLNKIAVSRQQRGGINLHRSLLVSHVLMQAKNVYIMENYQAVMQARNSVMENNNVIYKQDTSKCADVPTCNQYNDQSYELDNAGHPVRDDAGADLVDKENQECDMENTSAKTGCTEYSKEDNDSEQDNTKDNKVSSCNKCTKRRLDDITSHHNNMNNVASQTQNSDSESEADCSGAKRIKLEDSCVSSSSNNSSYTPCNNAPVSRPDCKQISSLVNRFSVGFSGLLNTDRRQSSEEAINRSPYAEENSCHVQGPLDSPISCSSQIAGFSPVTPQAIALTV